MEPLIALIVVTLAVLLAGAAGRGVCVPGLSRFAQAFSPCSS